MRLGFQVGQLGFQGLELGQILGEEIGVAGAITQAFEMALEFVGAICRQLVYSPIFMRLGFDQSIPFEEYQVFGDFDLRGAQDSLEVAHAHGAMRQEVEDAQAGFIAEALVNLKQLHRKIMPETEYTAISIY